jgi:putative transposase
VLRYAEFNPVRAKLVKKAEQWQWSSASQWRQKDGRPSFLTEGLVERPKDWLAWVNQAAELKELEALRLSVNRGNPFGSPGWVARTAKQLGLESTLRPRGRPKKAANEPRKK